MRYQFIVLEEDAGKRAYEILHDRHGFSRVQIKKTRLYGELLVNGFAHRMIDPLYGGDKVSLKLEEKNELPHAVILQPQTDLPIYFQDEWFLVVGKPAGLLTHPSYTGEKESLITRLSEFRLHPITRLDRGTSGLIILAKSAQAHYSLTNTTISKTYTGLVYGAPEPAKGLIDAPIGRLDGSIIERQVRADGKVSQTKFQVIKRYGHKATAATALSFELITGRTHQIRVHCQHSGFPMLGDSLYPPTETDRARFSLSFGEEILNEIDTAAKCLGHQALHASTISFRHPISQKELSFEMPWPDDMQLLAQRLAKIARSIQ